MTFVFLTDFANNWKAGQEVEVTEVPDHDKELLVDSVALISKSDLLQHGYFADNQKFVFTEPFMDFKKFDMCQITTDQNVFNIDGVSVSAELATTVGHLVYGPMLVKPSQDAQTLHTLLQCVAKYHSSSYAELSKTINEKALDEGIHEALVFMQHFMDATNIVEEKADVFPVQRHLAESFLHTELTVNEWKAMIHDWNAFSIDPARYNNDIVIGMISSWLQEYRIKQDTPKKITM